MSSPRGLIVATKEDVLRYMQKNRLTGDFYEIMFSANLIASHFKISKYMAGKLLRQLKDDGSIYYGKMSLPCDSDYETGDCYCENHLPIWGYRTQQLSDKGSE